MISNIDEVEEGEVAETLEAWADSFRRQLSSSAIRQATRTEAVDALASFVNQRAAYDESLTFDENVCRIFWIIKSWRTLNSVCPAMNPILSDFLGNGECCPCHGCGGRHLYFAPDSGFGSSQTFVLDIADGSIFEADGDNVCKGQYCNESITIMRCSDGQAFDVCPNGCDIGLCGRCWGQHHCNLSDDSSTCS